MLMPRIRRYNPQHKAQRCAITTSHDEERNEWNTTMVSNPHACVGIVKKWEVRLYVASQFLVIAYAVYCLNCVFYGRNESSCSMPKYVATVILRYKNSAAPLCTYIVEFC